LFMMECFVFLSLFPVRTDQEQRFTPSTIVVLALAGNIRNMKLSTGKGPWKLLVAGFSMIFRFATLSSSASAVRYRTHSETAHWKPNDLST
jgi:hypothetical protein